MGLLDRFKAATGSKTSSDNTLAVKSETAVDGDQKSLTDSSVSDRQEQTTKTGANVSTAVTEKTVGTTNAAPVTALVAEERAAEEAQEAAASADDDNEEANYPHGAKLAVITLALMLSVFLMALDNTIIATAIPKITDQFNSLNDVGWYGSAYLLTTCALQLFFGKLYTYYSIKWVYLTAILIFEIGSAICGAAPSSTALIVGRAIAGLGSSGIFSGALVIIAYSVSLRKRPLYMGIIGGCYGIASIAGPLLGGAFTDGPGWPWCFYINLPLGAITIVVIALFFKSPERKSEQKVAFKERAKTLDLGGVAIFIVMIICLLLALQWGGSTYAWSNWRIILCLVIFGILLIIFIGVQWYMGENATVPFHIIKQRSVAAACVWSAALGGSFFVMIYWVPIWFQAIKNATALESGIRCIPMVLALVLANLIAGGLVSAIGYVNPFYYASVIFSAVGAGLLTTWMIDTKSGMWIGYQIIYGFGIGFGMQNGMITVQTMLPLKDVPVGVAMIAFFQTFGGALFVSAAQNVFNNRLISELVATVPGVTPALVISTGATSLKTKIPEQFLRGVQLAYNRALTQTWYIAVALSALTLIPALLIEWRSIKGMKPGAHAA